MLGQVGSSGVLDHVDCSVGFRLQAPPMGARILSAGLRCALLNQAAAKRQPRIRSAFLADLGKLATADVKVMSGLFVWTSVVLTNTSECHLLQPNASCQKQVVAVAYRVQVRVQ